MSKFTFKILWLENNIAIAIDYIIGDNTSPLTSYFFWPRNDAWKEMKIELESKPWINENERVDLLNKTTEIINFWQEKEKSTSLRKARERFPEFNFIATN
uniref:Small ribosomal subunit protein cS23 n=1 Tax=Gracilaria vermiculophylla TaxID=2608709 RepID=A0A345U990_9FLOR|nr:plastid-specific 30S ribosomal protein 3 [Gracilaria vermiculophylla]AXI97026.1 plastid-specific 30S ribosomal protein 3 [Gracilaria vermiculophylla]QXU75228.1 plastid-specific 30S ribosomal protein 3 [Gracilaria vermiculophylla]WDZ68025.1 plastid-specific 30S ribosomal protein 3 [Gracilaria vermiculophylla]